jgi:hypothetical protein
MLRQYHQRPRLLASTDLAWHETSRNDISGLESRLQRERLGRTTVETNVNIRRVHVNEIHVRVENNATVSRVERDLQAFISDARRLDSGPDAPAAIPYRSEADISVNRASESQNKREIRHNPSLPKIRRINLGTRTIDFTNKDVQWPLGIISFTDDISRLFREWENSQLVKLKGFAVPMKLWGELYRNAEESPAWISIKKQYSESKVL